MKAGIIVGVLVIYLAAMLYIGYRGSKFTSTLTDYLTAGKKGTLLMVAGSYLGAHIGTGIVVGGATNGANYGLAGAWYGIGAALSFILFGIFCAKWAYKNNFLTIPAFFRQSYPRVGKMITAIWAILGAAVAITTLSGQIVAGKNLFQYMGLNPLLGCIISMVVVYIYCSAAGMWGVMMTDVWQVVIITIGLIITVAHLFINRDAATVLAGLDSAKYYTAVPFDAKTLILMVVPTALYGLTGGANMQRTASAANEKVAFRAPLIGGALTAVFTFLPVLIGMYGMGSYEGASASSIIFQVMVEELPPVLAGIMLAAIVAAIMSTCDTTIMTIITNIVYDTYGNVIAPKFNMPTDDKRLKTASKVITLLLCVAAICLAFVSNSITSLLSKGYTMFAAGGLIPFLGARYWKKTTDVAVVASMFTGMLVALLNTLGVIHLINGILACIPAAVVLVVVALCTQKKDA